MKRVKRFGDFVGPILSTSGFSCDSAADLK